MYTQSKWIIKYELEFLFSQYYLEQGFQMCVTGELCFPALFLITIYNINSFFNYIYRNVSVHKYIHTYSAWVCIKGARIFWNNGWFHIWSRKCVCKLWWFTLDVKLTGLRNTWRTGKAELWQCLYRCFRRSLECHSAE